MAILVAKSNTVVKVVCLGFAVSVFQPLNASLGQEYFRVEYVDRNNQRSGVA